MIKELIEKLTCKHAWKEFFRRDFYWFDWDKRPYKTKVTLICKKCGMIKKICV